jgi:CHAD domain-containing protein
MSSINASYASILNRSGCVFFARWEELLHSRRSAMKNCDLETVHDLRVASRRFRAAMGLLEPIVPQDSLVELNKSIRSLTRKLGSLRNIDEAIVFFQSHLEAGSAAEKQLRLKLSKLRGKEIKQIFKSLTNFDQRKNDKTVRKAVAGIDSEAAAGPNSLSITAHFSAMNAKLYQSIRNLLVLSTDPENSEARHELRIAIKKWRYFLEIVSVVLERDCTALLGQLKDYQSILGSMNDIIEFRNLLDKMKLSPLEREYAETALINENNKLLAGFMELVNYKPLTCSLTIEEDL